jgi:hypothetical protein
MKSFLELQSTIPTFQVICEADTHSEYKVTFEFQVQAINEKVASEKADVIVNELNLKNIKKSLKRK